MAQADRVLSTPRRFTPRIVATTCSEDPIFAAIRKHRRAYAIMEARFAEHRRAHELADAKVGPSDIEILSRVERGKIVKASCWRDIEEAVPSEKFPQLNARYNQLLDERRASRDAIIEPLVGDEDEATNEVAGPEFEALKAFANTVPTTLDGLLTMLIYAGEVSEQTPEAFEDFGWLMIDKLAIAARALVVGGQS